MHYYEIHCFLSRTEGYSIAVKSETELNDDEAIALAVKQKKFSETGDEELVDYVNEIDIDTFVTFNLKS